MEKQTNTLFKKIIKIPSCASINKGFTLLEIVVAIAIFAIIISCIYPAYTSTYNNIEIAENESDIYYMARVAMARIVDDLESAYIPVKSSKDELTDLNAFIGQNEYIDSARTDKIRFYSKAHINFGDNFESEGDAKIEYYAHRDEDTGEITLYRSDTEARHDWPEEKTEGYILCEGLQSFYLTYTDKSGQEYGTWDSSDINFKNILPSLIVITLEFIDDKNPEKPLRFTTGVYLPMSEKNE
ncbi:prepilin-type N-terminal cleavage/methylation domain-containing protein [Thermodesulfobacteriota bacterium]